ncbi:acyltransferase domain-containing protein, partial [Streptomyces niveus]
ASLAGGVSLGGVVEGVVGGGLGGGPVFVFPGQGSQWVGMGAELLDESVVFAEWVGRCEVALSPFVDWSLVDVLRGVEGAPGLDRVDVVQPVLFAVMVSLAEVWRSLGVVPGAVVGHSQGEIAAACVAGALSLEDAARVVALRSRVIGVLAGRGGMGSVPLPVGVVVERLGGFGGVSVAAVNGPSSTVISGDAGEVAACVEVFRGEGVSARVIAVDYASHSVQVEEVEGAVREALACVVPRVSEVAFYSTLEGRRIDTSVLDADYWYRNLRGTVEFDATVRLLLEDGFSLFVESSPHPVLSVAVGETVEEVGAAASVVGTLRRDEGGWRRFLTSAATAWTHGA